MRDWGHDCSRGGCTKLEAVVEVAVGQSLVPMVIRVGAQNWWKWWQEMYTSTCGDQGGSTELVEVVDEEVQVVIMVVARNSWQRWVERY